MIGYYYLHTNGDLIYKKYRPEPSDFVRKIWEFDDEERGHAWLIVIEAKAMGARQNRIDELTKLWNLTDEDAQNFIKNGLFKLFKDGDRWCAAFNNIQESQCGFGDTCLEALSELAKPGLVG